MFPLSSLSPSSSSRPLLLPTPDLRLHSPCSLLRRNLNPDPDLDPNFDLVVDAPEAAVPLDLFLPLIHGDLDLDPDIFLASQEAPPIPLPSSLSPPLLLPSPSLRLRQPQPPPPIRPVNLSAAVLRRLCPYLAGGAPPLIFRRPSNIGRDRSFPLLPPPPPVLPRSSILRIGNRLWPSPVTPPPPLRSLY